MDAPFQRFGDRLQVLAGLAADGRLREFASEVRGIAHELPVPLNFAETCVLERLLDEFVRRATRSLLAHGVSVPHLDQGLAVTHAFRWWARALPNEIVMPELHYATAPEPLRRVLRTMQQDYHKPLKVRDLAGAVGWSEPYLCEMFRQSLGITVHQCLTRIRMAKAASLLRHGTKPDAVALLVGYRSPSRFYDAFRKAKGCTPGEFQRSETARPA